IDPGDHRLEAHLGERQAYERISIPEGGSAKVVLQLGTIVDKLEPKRAAQQPTQPAQDPDAWAVSPGQQRRRTAYLAAGGAALGIGVVGVVMGGVAGGIAVGQKGTLDTTSGCDPVNHICAPRQDLKDKIANYNTSRHVSTAGFIIGG